MFDLWESSEHFVLKRQNLPCTCLAHPELNPLFTTQSNPGKSIDRTSFDKELNTI